MKKSFVHVLLGVLLALPVVSAIADTVFEGQSTEGKDFWVTFMQADQNDHSDNDDKAVTLALTVSAKEECDVTFTNPYTKEVINEHFTAGSIKEISFYTGDGGEKARTRTDAKKAKITCYSIYPDSVDNSAVHVESTAPISLFASNRRSKSFDATNVLPTASLLSEYLIQSVPPSDHEGKPQGTHFAIIAMEDNTVVDYCPTVQTTLIRKAIDEKYYSVEPLSLEKEKLAAFKVGDTLTTPVLKKGQVYYVWTGKYSGNDADLSGTWLKARNNKKIAVFQGAPHTNLPDQIRDRDHLFSQAMPVDYWGNTFVITASLTRGRDIVRVMARDDGTEVRINGKLEHTFDFASNPKRTFEFEIGKKGVSCTDKNHKGTLPDPLIADSSCYITTSCPAATHIFMVSNTYDANPVGDPAMVWVNPIEQRINDITFATYGKSNTHYFNVVTDKAGVASMKLDGNSIASDFHPVAGSGDAWYFARKNITYDTHRLTGNTGFIAHVYGYGSKESYGYSAGGATKPLTQFITINGKIFTPDSDNTLCGDDSISFACHPDYEYKKIEWYFGDNQSDLTNKDSVVHVYTTPGTYHAYVLIYRESSNVCVGQNAKDSIPIRVTIGNFAINWKRTEIPTCIMRGEEADIKIYLDNPGGVPLKGDSVTLTFDQVTKNAGFSEDEMKMVGDTMLIIHVPSTATDKTNYTIHVRIGSECEQNVFEKDIQFQMFYDVVLLAQRYNNILGLMRDSFPTQELSNFVWYRNGEPIKDENSSVLYLDETNPDNTGEYILCFDVKEANGNEYSFCTCPLAFQNVDKKHTFKPDADGLAITAAFVVRDGKVFVNADYQGEANIECYAQWITVSGQVYNDLRFDIPDGGCLIPAPAEKGLYLLRVVTDKESRSFKFVINQ